MKEKPRAIVIDVTWHTAVCRLRMRCRRCLPSCVERDAHADGTAQCCSDELFTFQVVGGHSTLRRGGRAACEDSAVHGVRRNNHGENNDGEKKANGDVVLFARAMSRDAPYHKMFRAPFWRSLGCPAV